MKFDKLAQEMNEEYNDRLNIGELDSWSEEALDQLISDYKSMELCNFILKYKVHADDLQDLERIMTSIIRNNNGIKKFIVLDNTAPIYLTLKQIKEMDDYAIMLLYWDFEYLQIDAFNLKYKFPAGDYDKICNYIEKKIKSVHIERWIDGKK